MFYRSMPSVTGRGTFCTAALRRIIDQAQPCVRPAFRPHWTGMKLSKEELEEFIQRYENALGDRLTFEEALELMERLRVLYETLRVSAIDIANGDQRAEPEGGSEPGAPGPLVEQ